MPLRLDYQASDFDAQFKALLSQKRETESDVVDTVKAILNDVKPVVIRLLSNTQQSLTGFRLRLKPFVSLRMKSQHARRNVIQKLWLHYRSRMIASLHSMRAKSLKIWILSMRRVLALGIAGRRLVLLGCMSQAEQLPIHPPC